MRITVSSSAATGEALLQLLKERFGAPPQSPEPIPAHAGGPDTLEAIVARRRVLNAAMEVRSSGIGTKAGEAA